MSFDMGDQEKTFSLWNGFFETYEEARAEGSGFKSERWMERIEGQLLDYRQERQNHVVTPPPRQSDLPMLCALVRPESILDFGGSSGWAWDYLQESLPGHGVVKYLIQEIEDVVNYMESTGNHQAPVAYIAEFPDEHIDVLYFNSVLQYVCDDHVAFDLVRKCTPDFILIEDFLGGEFEDYYTLQKYYENEIPVKFRNRKQFLQAFRHLGYDEILTKPYITTSNGMLYPFPMSALPVEKRIEYGETFLLGKSKDHD